ncbi:MAG: thioredoxin fold domain-containing protein [Saprospiraceae bacterium]
MTYSSIKKRLFYLGFFSLFLSNLSAQVAFQETSFSNARLIIQEEQLPYIIYFYGEWCPACQMMEEMTFKNRKVKERIEKDYVIFKVNTESARGKEWMATYNVSSVPTTLFYNKDHELLNRLETSITATDFLKITAGSGNLSNKRKLATTSSSLDAKKRRVNSSPKELLEKEDLGTTIAVINLELASLKALNKNYTPNTVAKKDILTPKGLPKSPTSYPTAKTIVTQIDACKSLLTGPKNIQRLIHILEDYKLKLVGETKKAPLQKQVIIPVEYKAPVKKVVLKKPTGYDKKYAYNQQIISFLKLTPPVKTGRQFIVQIGKYQNIRNAERLVQRIQDKYDYPIKVHIQKQGETPIQIVYLGEFATEAEAVAANENLKWIDRKGIVKQF